jgi:hypothetical protein
VVVSESFDPATAAKLRTALREGTNDAHAENFPQEEIGSRLLEVPAFQVFAKQVGDRIADELSREAGR